MEILFMRWRGINNPPRWLCNRRRTTQFRLALYRRLKEFNFHATIRLFVQRHEQPQRSVDQITFVNLEMIRPSKVVAGHRRLQEFFPWGKP
jgi:hypothetical protein